MSKTAKVSQKAYYHGLLVQVETKLESLALIRLNDQLSIVPTNELKEAPYQFGSGANAGSAEVSDPRS